MKGCLEKFRWMTISWTRRIFQQHSVSNSEISKWGEYYELSSYDESNVLIFKKLEMQFSANKQKEEN